MSNLRDFARDKPCQIRLPAICSHDPATTVLAHFRIIGVSGMGLKPPDVLASWACAACHAYVDSHHDDETQLAFANGVMRTLAFLVKLEQLKW